MVFFPSFVLFCILQRLPLNWILASFITFLIFSLFCHSYISGPKLVHATYWITHMKNQSWLVFPWPPPIPSGLATVYSTNGRPSKVQNYQSSHHHTPPKKKKTNCRFFQFSLSFISSKMSSFFQINLLIL